MAEPTVAGEPARRPLRRVVTVLVACGLIACAAVAGLEVHDEHLKGLTGVLTASAVVAGVTVVPTLGRAGISASFIVVTLAAALLGPASAALCALAAELAAVRQRGTKPLDAAFNVVASVVPALVAANLILAVHPRKSDSAAFFLLIAAASLALLTLNYVLVSLYLSFFRGRRSLSLRLFWEYTPTQALNIALAVAGAGIYVKVGLPGIVFALVALFSFSYQAHLLEQSRHRAAQYVSLSFGVLAGLMRSMDVRDRRAARHAAAVARFSKDMAKELKMSAQELELAHTAGLLHDIGHFALSDRVHERGRVLTDEDWEAIHQHPELGADMLRDLGMYGPVAEIVLAHHERIDGLGYPNGLTGEEIPPLAKIIAVAEAYDTLTARDTYRTPMSSFEALVELREHTGTQFEGPYVEVLASVLKGENVDYRHADAADFDIELDMERRIKEARAG
jgi:putative nucleotidyltransferase with HDIG domain